MNKRISGEMLAFATTMLQRYPDEGSLALRALF